MEDFLIVLKRLSRGSGDGWQVELGDDSFCEENFFNQNLAGHSAYDDMNISLLTLQMSEEDERQRVDGEQIYGHVTKVARHVHAVSSINYIFFLFQRILPSKSQTID